MSEIAASAFGALTPDSEDRRQESREGREGDPRASRWIDRHWHQVVWVGGILFAACGVATKTLGLRVAGPSEAFAVQAHADSGLVDRVTRLEKRADRVDVALTLQSYLLCVNNHSADPVVLERCRPIIESMQSRGAP